MQMHRHPSVSYTHLYFRATDPLIDPADNITQNALRVVVELLLDFFRRPVRFIGNRNRQQIIQNIHKRLFFHSRLRLFDIDPVSYTHLTLYALDVEKLPLAGRFTGQDVLAAMKGHILDQASITGVYSLNPEIEKTL